MLGANANGALGTHGEGDSWELSTDHSTWQRLPHMLAADTKDRSGARPSAWLDVLWTFCQPQICPSAKCEHTSFCVMISALFKIEH